MQVRNKQKNEKVTVDLVCMVRVNVKDPGIVVWKKSHVKVPVVLSFKMSQCEPAAGTDFQNVT